MSRYRANRISNRALNSGTIFTGITTFSSTSHIQVPVGFTTQRSGTETSGSLRFNLDTKKLEFYDGVSWNQVAVVDNMQRGLFGPGDSISPTSTASNIESINIPSGGTGVSFGTLTLSANARQSTSAVASPSRALFGGGLQTTPGNATHNIIDYVTISSAGNAVDFGDLINPLNEVKSHSSSTRGIFIGGNSPAPVNIVNVIQQVTIATTGNAVDFGDASTTTMGNGALGSPTRAVYCTGRTASPSSNTIEYITITSEGNATDFGDLPAAYSNLAAASNSVRGLFGYNTDVLASITIASTGNAVDFAQTSQHSSFTGCSNSTRGVFTGASAPGYNTFIDYVVFNSGGNSIYFGDLTANKGRYLSDGATSDSHGGIS